MDRMKYIVYTDGWKLPTPVIFPDYIQHNQMAMDLGIAQDKLLGAGFIDFSPDGLRCYGDSFSLKVKAREVDGIIINKMLGGGD